MDQAHTIEHILTSSHSIAVVGLSDKAARPSHRVARYLQSMGFHIIPVNPKLSEVLGERAYADLLSVPHPVDVVDVFRRPEAVPGIVDQAILIGAKAVWMQEGVRHPEAAQRAEAAGLLVVMDHCMLKETKRLVAEGRFRRPHAVESNAPRKDEDERLSP